MFGIEEERVDAEIVSVFVRRDDLRVQEQLLARILHEPDSREHDRQRDRHAQAPQQQLARPAHVAQEHEQQPEGDVEERDVLRRLRVVGGIHALQRIQHDGPEQQPFHADRREPAGRFGGRHISQFLHTLPSASVIAPVGVARAFNISAEPSGQQECDRPRGHHQVERDQQVDRTSVGGDGQSERERGDREQRQRLRATTHQQ